MSSSSPSSNAPLSSLQPSPIQFHCIPKPPEKDESASGVPTFIPPSPASSLRSISSTSSQRSTSSAALSPGQAEGSTFGIKRARSPQVYRVFDSDVRKVTFAEQTYLVNYCQRDTWAKRKSSSIPWAHISRYAVDIPIAGGPVAFWFCEAKILSNNCMCCYVAVEFNDRDVVQNIRTQFTKHLVGPDHMLGSFVGPVAKNDAEEKDNSNKESNEFVKHWLTSGLPFTSVCDVGDLKTYLCNYGVPVPCRPVFASRALAMTSNAYKINAVCSRISIAKRGNCMKAIRDLMNKLDVNMLLWGSDCKVDSDRANLVSGSADMGPGPMQGIKAVVGSAMFVPRTAHGVHNGSQAVCDNTAVAQLMKACWSTSKSSRESESARIESKLKNISLGQVEDMKRWNVRFRATSWVERSWDRLKTCSFVSAKAKTIIEERMEQLHELNILIDWHERTFSVLQLSLPGDCLFVPLQIVNLLHYLRTCSFSTDVAVVRDLLVARTTRRFFYEELLTTNRFGNKDSTRMYSFFSNKLVLASWALSPHYDFLILNKANLATRDMCVALQQRAEEALLALHRHLQPAFFVEGVGLLGALPGVTTPSEIHRSCVTELREKTRHAWRMFETTIKSPAKGIYSKARLEFFQQVMAAANDTCFKDVLRACYGARATSVADERNFSIFQNLMRQHRLAMRSELAFAYFLAKMHPEFMDVTVCHTSPLLRSAGVADSVGQGVVMEGMEE